ncbi:MAG: LuxR C-terminal-related transcriptional regulator [Acidobacteriia bacterium]|nr:LuxR C-terminal-related transcriptional regulator [Terriglobia bacterium]
MPRGLTGWMNTSEGMYVVDGRQRILAWNKGAERMLGYTESEVLNRPCYEVMGCHLANGKLLCQSNCQVSRCVQRGSLPQAMDARTHTKEGREIWLNISIVVFPRKRNPLVLHSLRDITLDQHARQATEEIVHALQASGVMPNAEDAGHVLPGPPPAPSATGTLAVLTRRELEVLRLLAEGLASSAIATRLGISIFTVRNHVQNILGKLAVQNKAQAVACAYKSGLL